MKSWAITATPLCVWIVVACGGELAPVGDGGTSPPKDAPSGDAPQPPPPPSVDCNALRASIDSLSQQARTCCPFCNSQQCGHTAQGLCCPVSITAASAPELDKAVNTYKSSCGPVACPATPCPKAPSFNCPSVPNGPSFCN